jgi:superfamily II DNA or RNA helicase
MLKETSWAPGRAYRSGTDHEPLEFYLGALSNSTQFDLLLGYFSSSAINVLSLGFAKFLHAGGSMRVVANNVLSAADKQAIKEGQGGQLPDDLLDLSDIRALKASLSETGRHFLECFAWLIAKGRIQFVIVKPKGRLGIAHYKSGVFSDGQDQIGFKASCNFTAYGMLENLEELDAFLSWEDARSQAWLKEQKVYFDAIHSGASELVDYVAIEEAEVAIRSEFGSKDLNELLVQEHDLLTKRRRLGATPGLKRVAAKLEKDLDEIAAQPRFPRTSGPRPYQKEAYQNWVSNNRQGVFAMATGTGKTITALNAVLNEYDQTNTYQCIILAPTKSLVNQWNEECKKFNFQNIIRISSDHDWKRPFESLMLGLKFSQSPFIVIATYASYTRNTSFQKLLECDLPNAILIADEAHNMGANKMANLITKIRVKKRIGLSATINRKYDQIGNASIDKFFSDQHPYTFSFGMREAIEQEYLCRYYYKPHIVTLTDDEMIAYKQITAQIAQLYNFANDSMGQGDIVSRLLIKRKRIIDKASSKLPLFQKILQERFREHGSLAYTLVYVPEGKEPDYSSDDDSRETEEDLRLIDEYTRATRDIDPSVLVRPFTADTENRNEILDSFTKGSLHVITSMKCLDEGVDIPRAEFAVFCASSGNPRQFIQRRGRVLRTARPFKSRAIVHDMVVVPQPSGDPSLFNLEKRLFQRELERVWDFAHLSENSTDAYIALKATLDYYELSMYDSVENTGHD